MCACPEECPPPRHRPCLDFREKLLPGVSTSRGTIQRDRLRTSTEHPADLGPASAMGNEREGLPLGTIIKDTDKDDGSVALPESLPCAGHSLSLTQLLAQRGLGGHRVLIP